MNIVEFVINGNSFFNAFVFNKQTRKCTLPQLLLSSVPNPLIPSFLESFNSLSTLLFGLVRIVVSLTVLKCI